MRLSIAMLACACLVGGTDARAQDCTPERYEPQVEVNVVDGRPALRRPLERLVREHVGALARCFVAGRRRPDDFAPRDATATVTVSPDGQLEASVELRERHEPPSTDGAGPADDAAELDERLTACLSRELAAQPLPRPTVAAASPMAVRIRFRFHHTPARPCSDPAPTPPPPPS